MCLGPSASPRSTGLYWIKIHEGYNTMRDEMQDNKNTTNICIENCPLFWCTVLFDFLSMTKSIQLWKKSTPKCRYGQAAPSVSGSVSDGIWRSFCFCRRMSRFFIWRIGRTDRASAAENRRKRFPVRRIRFGTQFLKIPKSVRELRAPEAQRLLSHVLMPSFRKVRP